MAEQEWLPPSAAGGGEDLNQTLALGDNTGGESITINNDDCLYIGDDQTTFIKYDDGGYGTPLLFSEEDFTIDLDGNALDITNGTTLSVAGLASFSAGIDLLSGSQLKLAPASGVGRSSFVSVSPLATTNVWTVPDDGTSVTLASRDWVTSQSYGVGDFLKNGSVVMTGNLNMGSQDITNADAITAAGVVTMNGGASLPAGEVFDLEGALARIQSGVYSGSYLDLNTGVGTSVTLAAQGGLSLTGGSGVTVNGTLTCNNGAISATVTGGTGSGDNLIIQSTSHATKGVVRISDVLQLVETDYSAGILMLDGSGNVVNTRTFSWSSDSGLVSDHTGVTIGDYITPTGTTTDGTRLKGFSKNADNDYENDSGSSVTGWIEVSVMRATKTGGGVDMHEYEVFTYDGSTYTPTGIYGGADVSATTGYDCFQFSGEITVPDTDRVIIRVANLEDDDTVVTAYINVLFEEK